MCVLRPGSALGKQSIVRFVRLGARDLNQDRMGIDELITLLPRSVESINFRDMLQAQTLQLGRSVAHPTLVGVEFGAVVEDARKNVVLLLLHQKRDLLAGPIRDQLHAVDERRVRTKALRVIETAKGPVKCPRCTFDRVVKNGRARGLQRYRCVGCGKTFNATTGTPLAGLHHKERFFQQYVDDVYNTFYVDAELSFDLDERTRLTLGAQYFPQRSVGDAQIGDFSTWGAALQANLAHGPFGAHLSFTRTGTDFATQNPYGDHPSYLNLQQVPFNSAGERAWGLGGSINFANLGVPGLSAAAVYAAGTERVDNATGAPIPDRNETDLRADDRFGKGHLLAGLVATLRYSWLHQDGSPQTQARVIVNYPLSF
jgi:transposase-like protein